MNLGRFQSLLQRQGRQNGGESFGQHGFARTRWANHNNVVTPGSGNFQCPLDVFLPLYVREINIVGIHGIIE